MRMCLSDFKLEKIDRIYYDELMNKAYEILISISKYRRARYQLYNNNIKKILRENNQGISLLEYESS